MPSFENLYGLHEFANIRELNLQATPVTDEKGGDMKKELLIVYCDQLLRFTKINKEEYMHKIFIVTFIKLRARLKTSRYACKKY